MGLLVLLLEVLGRFGFDWFVLVEDVFGRLVLGVAALLVRALGGRSECSTAPWLLPAADSGRFAFAGGRFALLFVE